jgi:hypothetical protein
VIIFVKILNRFVFIMEMDSVLSGRNSILYVVSLNFRIERVNISANPT